MDIGQMMYNRRKELGLTLEQVGDVCGVGKSTVRKWENGMIQNIKRDKIALLAKALKISPLSFVKGEIILENITPDEQASKEQIKFALYGGAEGITDDMIEEVMRFAEYIKQQRDNK